VRENRQHGLEGGEGESPSRPLFYNTPSLIGTCAVAQSHAPPGRTLGRCRAFTAGAGRRSQDGVG
jgi:hypothetical protein